MTKTKTRKRTPKTTEMKQLKKIRGLSPVHTIEIELKASLRQEWKLIRINEQLRVIP